MLVGVLGCMAERLKAKFLEEEKLVDSLECENLRQTIGEFFDGSLRIQNKNIAVN